MIKMSTKEERYDILDDMANRILTSDAVSNNPLVNESKPCDLPRNISVLSEKSLTENIIKKGVPPSEVQKLKNEYLVEYSLDCSVCQNICKNCRSICVTCKAPCSKCAQQSCENSSTDTDDFDKYLESLSRKIKVQPKVKTTGTDTCDLEGHFDYYKLEKKTIRIQKHVATDCNDLNLRRPVAKKPHRTSVGVDTSDLASVVNDVQTDESDCEFFWNEKEDPKTYLKKPNVDRTLRNGEKTCGDDDISENSLVIDEDVSLHPTIKEDEANKENFSSVNNAKDVFSEDVSTSEESDIDLATSSKVSKCRTLAKKHNITLRRINSEKDVVFKCSICSKTFQKKYLGILHLGCHIDSNFFKCLSCSEKFTTLDLLYSHVKETHISEEKKAKKQSVDVGENKENSESDSVKGKINKVYKVYKCAICSSSEGIRVEFSSFKSLQIHKKEKHGIKTEKKLRIKREFICLLCGKQFKSSKALKDHSPVHTGEKNYHCDICNKSYTTSANLKIHKKTHSGTKDFVCTVCGKAFHKKDSLKVHFRKHSGERPFQCDLCPMKFDRNYILKNHRYTHFSEKTFICPVCGKTFTTHGGLNNHEKGHRKDPFAKKPRKPAVKPTLDTENAVICDVCGKIYSTKNNLRIHKFVHLGVKPFECTICHQTYAKKDSMLIHMRKHTDERPFACQTCGMTFYRNHTLKTHLLRHTGERPHKCKMCGKSFTQSSSLTYHLKNHDKKVEKKKANPEDSTKQKRKRVGQGGTKLGTKKIAKIVKPGLEFQPENVKLIFDEKKSVKENVQKDATVLSLSERGELVKGGHFMLPVSEKEVLIVDKSLGIEFARGSAKEIDFFSSDKEPSYGVQPTLGKFNYYIAKSHVFSPKDVVKPKGVPKEIEISVDKSDEDVEHLIISKGSSKEANIVTIEKGVKEEFVQIEDQRLDLKSQTTIPITGEILNAAFISDENGDVIPLSSMTLQGLNAENIMIGPVVAAGEGDDRKGIFRNPKFAVFDSKITYNIAAPRLTNEKSIAKGNGHIIHLKDSRISQRIQLELEPHSLHIQTPVVDDGTLHGIPEFYASVQPNGM